MTHISIFDVDRTITRRPTYSHFLLFAALRTAPWRLLLLPVLAPVALAYAAKMLPRRVMKEWMHRVALGRAVPRGKADVLARQFAMRMVQGGMPDPALRRISAEAAEGRTVVFATAAPALYIAPLAEALGVQLVVATRGRWQDDALTHRIDGPNCYGPAKLDMVRQALLDAGMRRDGAHLRFFTDHASDLPLCDWADEVFAVNPSRRMRGLARRRGWPVLDWKRG